MQVPQTEKPSRFWRPLGRAVQRTWVFCLTQLSAIILKTVEVATVVLVLIVTISGAWLIILRQPGDPARERMIDLITLINDNWKAFLILGIPLFFRTVRTFFEEVQEWAGMKRSPVPAPAKAQENPNPPDAL
jgi:hypothetical protein